MTTEEIRANGFGWIAADQIEKIVEVAGQTQLAALQKERDALAADNLVLRDALAFVSVSTEHGAMGGQCEICNRVDAALEQAPAASLSAHDARVIGPTIELLLEIQSASTAMQQFSSVSKIDGELARLRKIVEGK